MDQCTHEVRAEYWKRIIRACGQRPAGQSAKSWMEENGICEQSYYHWQRKFRQQAYGQMKASAPMNLSEVTVPAEAETTDISFVELPCCPACLVHNKNTQSCRGDSSKLQREFPQ